MVTRQLKDKSAPIFGVQSSWIRDIDWKVVIGYKCWLDCSVAVVNCYAIERMPS